MKKLILIFIIVFISHLNIYAQSDYGGNTHVYCINEASKFLFYTKGYNYLDILNNLESIRAGDLEEDEVDLVYGYHGITGDGVTATHFWDADCGWDYGHTIEWHGIPLYTNVPNAYMKVQRFIEGNFNVTLLTNGVIHHISYEPGLINYYNTGNVYCLEHGLENHDPATRKNYTYRILGHMIHLLQDMSVPIHSHVAIHPDECFEQECGNTGLLPTYLTAVGFAGGFINPFGEIFNYNPIGGLFYTANQIADLYPSNNTGECGGYNFPYNISGDLNFPLGQNSIIQNHYGTYFPNNGYYQESCWGVQKHRLVSHSISSTASLLYWFAVEAGLTEKVYRPVVTGMTSNMIGDRINGYTLFKGQTGSLYSTVQGNNIRYGWNYFVCDGTSAGQWPFNVANVISILPGDIPDFHAFNQNFTGESCLTENNLPSSKYLRAQLKVTNNYDAENWSLDYRINPSVNLVGGGCPYIFVLGNDTSGGKYFTENNILHHSEFTENANQSITDVYKLKTVPKIDSNKITIQIMETENDVNYFDQIKLFAVDHPVGSKIGITESNDIVMYYPNDVSSSDLATKNFSINNIAPYIQYGQPSPKITGLSNDFVNAHYDSTSQKTKLKSYKNRLKAKGFTNISDSLALIGEVGSDTYIIANNSTAKDWAGSISIYSNSDTYTKPFSKRVNVSDVIIPFSQTSDNVDKIDINFNSDYAMSYFSVVPVSYEGFTKTELSLVSAVHAVNGNILSTLSNIDNNFAIMDTTAIIDLKFGSINPPDPSMVRDYVFVVNGKYTSENSSKNGHNLSPMINNNVSPNNIIYKYKLNANYPNPFNPSTKINYELEKFGLTKLEVFDILGRSVKVLVNEYKQAGNYTFEFNGSNLPSGVYIYRLESNGFVGTKRMVLIK